MRNNVNITPAERWVSEQELALLLGMSSSAIARRRRTGGDLPRHTTTGERTHMYRLDDVEAWRDARTTDTNNEVAAKLIEQSRVDRDALPGTSTLLEMGRFTVEVKSLADCKKALAARKEAFPPALEELSVVEVVAECQLAGCLQQVTWSGRLSNDELRAVLVTIGTLTRQQPRSLGRANRLLSEVEVLAAVVIGAVEANLNEA